MTSQQKERLADRLVGAFFALIGALILAMATGAWTGKENAVDHKADIQAVRADILRVLDAVCAQTPNIPQCHTSMPNP